MRTSKVYSISLPPELAEKVKKISDKEKLSRSELTRLALRRFIESQKRWELLQKWGEESAQEMNLENEQEVAELVEDYREETQ